MTQVAEIMFGEWLPSAPDYNNPGCVVADNVIPTPGNAYGPVRQITAVDSDLLDEDGNPLLDELNVQLNPEQPPNTVSGTVKGAQQFFDGSDVSLIVGGTNTTLFTRRSVVAETTGLNAIGDGEAWDFAQFNDLVIATAVNNVPQYLTSIGSDDEWSALPGDPPAAKRCARVGEFLMLGNIDGAPNRIQWSHYNAPASSWAASRLTQAGSADLPPEGGSVQRIVGGRYAMVFQERAISRLSYVGPPTVWRRDDVTTGRGAVAPFSVVQVGFLVYYLSQDGFYVTNGATTEPIGNNRINRWFFDTIDQSKVGEVQGAVDWVNECIFWLFSEGGVGQDRAIIYSYGQNRWSTATISADWLVGSQVDGIDIDSIDEIYGDLDSVPVSLDAAEFRAGNRVLAGFVGGVYGTLFGSPLEATFETGAAQVLPKRRVFMTEVAPLIDATSRDERVSIRSWDQFNVAEVTPQVQVGWSGFAPVRAECHKAAVIVRKPAGTEWSDAQGVQIRFRGAGYR